uniref:Uncharacterized protein n=1 Tax=Siphoviridae sp. ctPUt3 TaxID=2825485 RepID=A0A8S5U4R7_9CAUD|nr:MAG TPA: hypothetical protein [Siphoviridae sp. ctPUt3]
MASRKTRNSGGSPRQITATAKLTSLTRSHAQKGWGGFDRCMVYAMSGLAYCLPSGSAEGRTTAYQVAMASQITDRWAREGLKRLEKAGLIEWKRGGIGPDGLPRPSWIRVDKKAYLALINLKEWTKRKLEIAKKRYVDYRQRVSKIEAAPQPPADNPALAEPVKRKGKATEKQARPSRPVVARAETAPEPEPEIEMVAPAPEPAGEGSRDRQGDEYDDMPVDDLKTVVKQKLQSWAPTRLVDRWRDFPREDPTSPVLQNQARIDAMEEQRKIQLAALEAKMRAQKMMEYIDRGEPIPQELADEAMNAARY